MSDTTPQTMRALVLPAPGAPLELREMPVPRPGPGEVLVRMAAAPINPSDLAMLGGEYGLNWPYPLVPGLEGSGTVAETGGGLMARALSGRRVAVAAKDQGCWAEWVVTDAARCVPLPRDMGLGTGAMALVNPLTAVALVDIARRGGHRALVSTAAGGALGAMIRRRARASGIHVIDVVRSAGGAERLRADGAEALDQSDPGFARALREACRARKCRLALDAVGGELTFALGQALARRGEIVVYGALAGEPLSLHPGSTIFKTLTLRGFWLSEWLPRLSLPARLRVARAALRDLGEAPPRVSRVVPLGEGPSAPAFYAEAMSDGKVLLDLGGGPLGAVGQS
jgi:NADPH:quinone reductase-like Zn-dependent oxidoreductase